MDFHFFLTDNKSGYKTTEKWLYKNHPELYHQIIKYSSDISLKLSFKEKIWFFYNNLKERPKCITCTNEIRFRERFDKPYGDFCSLNCINTNKSEMMKRQKKTFQNKYNVDFYPNHSEFVDKVKKSKKERYGDETYNNLEKSKKTKKEIYGDENFNNKEKYRETCLLTYGSENYSKSNNYFNQITKNFKSLYPDIKFTNITKSFVTIKCDDCGNECDITKQLLYERYKRNYVVCINCNSIGSSSRSGYEKEICDFLDEYQIKYTTNVKIDGKKTEIDIFIPEYNIGIEVNGVYWHNELFKSNTYHLDKTLDCKNNGISLIHIFEDEWLYNKVIVKSILKTKLNLITNRVYARKCEIKEINSDLSKFFLTQNHIQGNVNSKVRVGLFYNGDLVSLMTFSRGRIIMGGKKDEWELNRFCNLNNYNVIGSASKLLQYFIKKYEPNIIVSYSDIRLFDGGMYEKIGFKKISQSKPNYWYVLGDIRRHRFSYTKSKLVKEGYDENKTERQIMLDRKIYRIYDCGNIRWEYKN